jgi:hypothetical protein
MGRCLRGHFAARSFHRHMIMNKDMPSDTLKPGDALSHRCRNGAIPAGITPTRQVVQASVMSMSFRPAPNTNCPEHYHSPRGLSPIGHLDQSQVNTRVEVRFHVMSADWMEEDVRQRLSEQQSNRINKAGELVISSQEHRWAVGESSSAKGHGGRTQS